MIKVTAHTTDLLDQLQKEYCNFVQMWTEKIPLRPQIAIAIPNDTKIDILTRLQENKDRRGGDEAWWTELWCVCACGIISCYQLILNVYRHFTLSIHYSHTLNSIWVLDMETHILLCSKTTTEDTAQYFFVPHFKPDSLCAAEKMS